jgi:hypothetical protein
MNEWMVMSEGGREPVRVEAPVAIPRWEERPWIEVRALTDAEADARESQGVWEEYELVSDGLGETRAVVERRYDLGALRAYDYAHSVTDYLLPEVHAGGEIVARRGAGESEGERVVILQRMGPALSEWVREVIDQVNQRSGPQQADLATAKKNC